MTDAGLDGCQNWFSMQGVRRGYDRYVQFLLLEHALAITIGLGPNLPANLLSPSVTDVGYGCHCHFRLIIQETHMLAS